MLHGVDHPDAVEFIACELADTAARLEGKKAFSHFELTAKDVWRRRQERSGVPMSAPSRTRLKSLWLDEGREVYLRRQAFRLWASTITDNDIQVALQILWPIWHCGNVSFQSYRLVP
jgi:hypothetical protein